MRLGAMYGGAYTSTFFTIFDLIKRRKLPYVCRSSNFVSMVHVEDVVDAMFESSSDRMAANKVYNLTDGGKYTMEDIISCSAKALRTKVNHSPMDIFVSNVRELLGLDYGEFEFIKSDRLISTERIGADLGFKPSIGMEKGIAALADQFMKKRK